MLQALVVLGGVPQDGKIASVVANRLGTGVELVVRGEGLQKPRVFPFLNGKMKVLEFNAGMDGTGGKTTVGYGGVQSFNSFWYSATPPKVRINVRLDKPAEPVFTELPDGWRVTFNAPKVETPQMVAQKSKTPKIEDFPDKVPPIDTDTKTEAAKPKPAEKVEKPVLKGAVETFPETVPPLEKAPPSVKKEEAKVEPKVIAKTEAETEQKAESSKPKPEVKAEKFPDKVPPLETYHAPVVKTGASAVVQDRVTIDFVNTDIVQILKAVALQSGVNIVTSPDVKSSLTVKLTNVSIDEALRFVTSLAGLAYARVGSAYVVAPIDKIDAIRRQIAGEPPLIPPTTTVNNVTRSYQVRGGTAAELVKALGGDKGPVSGVTLRWTPETSISRQTVVLSGPDEAVDELLMTMTMLDAADEQNATFQVYEVKYLDPRSAREQVLSAVPGLRVLLAPAPAGNPRLYNEQEALNQARQGTQTTGAQQGTGTGNGGGETTGGTVGADLRVGTQEVTNLSGLSLPFNQFESVAHPMRLVLRGTPGQLEAARAFLGQTDVAPKQVALELRAMELSREDALKVGLDWSIIQGSGLVRFLRFNNGLSTPDQAGTVSGDFKGGDVIAALDQLADNRRLIARPNVLALDGRESEVFVGDVVRYIKQIQSTQNGITVTTDEVRVGVRMAVLARAGADGNIALDLRPTVSFLRGFTAVPGGGQLPQTSERTTQSTAVIKSGETLALGGLIQDIDRKTVGGIPILKDLPIVGALFRRTDNNRVRTEIVFFLTARIVDESTRQDAARPTGGTIPPKI